MANRRDALVVLAGLAAGLGVARAATPAQAVPGEDGLYTQPWFMQTFLDLREDLAEAAAQGKRFAVLWEQRGCPYCREMHLVNLAKPTVRDYIRDNFGMLQLNLWGSREVTDFDGKVLEERELARRWRVNFTPTIQFFPADLAAAGNRPGVDLEVARMPGYFKPFHFLSMFEFVRSGAYADGNFQRFLQDKFAELKAKGVDPAVW